MVLVMIRPADVDATICREMLDSSAIRRGFVLCALLLLRLLEGVRLLDQGVFGSGLNGVGGHSSFLCVTRASGERLGD
jgi:hypothetical protein